jgi:uncharacterized protein (DUF2252 family)
MSDNENYGFEESRAVRRQQGKELRKEVPRSSHGEWTPAADRPDPIGILQAQDVGRVQRLLPIKYGRMVASPFAFLRGSAAVMAADLAGTPTTGIHVQLCGDAHISNFGVFATPERQLVFDVNDFDETLPGPWEWDLKRLVASTIVAGRENGFSEKRCRRIAISAVERYGAAMEELAQARTLDVWYFYVDAEKVVEAFKSSSKKGLKQVEKMFHKAESKTQEQTLAKLTQIEDGRRRIISDPPLLVPLRELLSQEQKDAMTREQVLAMWEDYLVSLPADRRHLLRRFRMADAALRVGGVGSVGTRCTILLMEGGAQDDAIILQQKEAGASVLEQYWPTSTYKSPAQRVVEGQKLMQASSDIFLGWHYSELSGTPYYWRQLKDMKGSMDVALLSKGDFETYVRVCATCLARAHARGGDAAAIAGYIGGGGPLAEAMADFGFAYADQTLKDYQALQEAIDSGRIVAKSGI